MLPTPNMVKNRCSEQGCYDGRVLKKGIFLVVASIGMALAPSPARAQKSPLGQAAYARAQDHLVASRFAEAATEMETAVRFEPRFALGWYVLASASRRAAHHDRAIAAYRRYSELRPAEPDPYFGQGLCLQAIGDRAAATLAFQHYIASDTRSASREYIEAARKHLLDLQQAEPRPKTGGSAGGVGGAVDAGPAGGAVGAAAAASGSPLYEARQLRDHGKKPEAIARYRAAIAADSNAPDAHLELGALLVATRNHKDAAVELRTAVRLAPMEASAWYNLGFALRETGQAAEAVDAYQRYITLKPTDPDPHYGLGLALVSLGREDQALTEFRAYAALENRPTERRWLKKARAEIARIESTHQNSRATDASPPQESRATPLRPDATAPPGLVAPPPEKPRVDMSRPGDTKN